MFQHQGIWLPDGEKHFPFWMTKNGELVDGKGTYQIKKLRAALQHCKQFRTAVDVGAHVGLWSMQLAKRFALVHAFEPVPAFRECFSRNLPAELDGCTLVLNFCALGAAPGRVAMKVPVLEGGIDSGGTHVGRFLADLGDGTIGMDDIRDTQPVAGVDVEMRTLDSFVLQDVDFIKIDCEGYEHHVIAGARETLLRCRPCVIVEQKPHKLGPNFGIKGTPAVDALRELGAEVRVVMSGDYVLSF